MFGCSVCPQAVIAPAWPGDPGVGVGVADGRGVAVGVDIGVGVDPGVGVDEGLGVAVGVAVACGVGVGDATEPLDFMEDVKPAPPPHETRIVASRSTRTNFILLTLRPEVTN